MAPNILPSQISDLDSQADLDPTIQPSGSVNLAAEPAAILLTGVTGFVGAFLLHDLLQQTRATIYCLVRAETADHAMQRIRENLTSYALWQDSDSPRIVALVGDLKRPRLGLTPETFEVLAHEIDVIYHCGSKLSYVAPYEFLKAANIGGTQEALRLAVHGKLKPLHFVSSLGIFLAYKIPVGGQEDDELDANKCPDVGYFRTKYVAEKVVQIGRSRGIPVTIHRIGLMVGDSRTGLSNPDDFVARMLVGSIQAGVAPDVRTAMDMTPVNFASSAMVYLARQPESIGKVFHLLNPKPIHWSEIFDLVGAAGYPIVKLPFQEWVEAIEERADPVTNPLYPLLPFFHIDFARRMLGVSDAHYLALGRSTALRGLAGSGLACPPIDRTLINTFLSRLVASGRLAPAPSAPLATARV